MSHTVEELLVLPGQGRLIGNHIHVAIGIEHTSGVFCALKNTLQPHQIVVPHFHEVEDQAVYVISGELEFEIGGEGGLRFTAPTGSFIRKPHGVEHSFWNATETPSEYIELSGGQLFQKLVEKTGSSPMRAILDAKTKHEVHINAARVPGMLAKYGLTSVAAMNMPWEGMAPPKLL